VKKKSIAILQSKQLVLMFIELVAKSQSGQLVSRGTADFVTKDDNGSHGFGSDRPQI
jgi:hypothetical protein